MRDISSDMFFSSLAATCRYLMARFSFLGMYLLRGVIAVHHFSKSFKLVEMFQICSSSNMFDENGFLRIYLGEL